MADNNEIEIILYLNKKRIKCTNKGFIYLMAAIDMGLKDVSCIYSVTELYQAVGKIYDAKSTNVERAIRNAISDTGFSCKEFILNAVYSIKYGDAFDNALL